MKTLKKWERPDNYIGPNYDSYYVGLGISRDSHALERSNFRTALKLLGGESSCGCDDDCKCAVRVIRDSHWAVGWIEYVLVHESATDKVAILSNIQESLSDYPVLDDDDFIQEEKDEADETWKFNSTDMIREFLYSLGFKDPVIGRGKRAADIEEIARQLYNESIAYSGLENAWVREDSFERYSQNEGKWELPRMARNGNKFAALLCRTFNIETP
jgi:hypothetical protein